MLILENIMRKFLLTKHNHYKEVSMCHFFHIFSQYAIRAMFAYTMLGSALLSSLYAESSHVHWDYSDDKGPKHWGELSEAFTKCKIGRAQTPIDIIDSQTKSMEYAIKFSYARNTANLINNGHTIQINMSGADSKLDFQGISYSLTQLHFHTPSENHINGNVYPLEAHFVHQSASGKLLVLSVLFNEGTTNKALATIIKSAPKTADASVKFSAFDIAGLIPSDTSYYAFTGSLTTPPCTEDVQWVVLKANMQLDKGQLANLQTLLHHNARDIQPLNKRVVYSAKK